ncbi:hypothetical protein B9Z19DRAFT_993805, partial [Tuber borchii]
PGPGQVTITGVTYTGSGCPPGTAHISISPDWAKFTLIFDSFGLKLPEAHKDCTLNFQVSYPLGYQFTISKIDYTGYVLLGLGVTAKQTSSHWFSGFVGDKQTFQSTLYGPYSGQYSGHYILPGPLPGAVWSPCGASTTVNINTQLFLNSNKPNSPGMINISSNGSKMQYQYAYDLNWRTCK